MGNKNNTSATDKDYVERLKIYEKLLSMGFQDKNAFNASIKFPFNLQKAVNHAIDQEKYYKQKINDNYIQKMVLFVLNCVVHCIPCTITNCILCKTEHNATM